MKNSNISAPTRTAHVNLMEVKTSLINEVLRVTREREATGLSQHQKLEDDYKKKQKQTKQPARMKWQFEFLENKDWRQCTDSNAVDALTQLVDSPTMDSATYTVNGQSYSAKPLDPPYCTCTNDQLEIYKNAKKNTKVLLQRNESHHDHTERIMIAYEVPEYSSSSASTPKPMDKKIYMSRMINYDGALTLDLDFFKGLLEPLNAHRIQEYSYQKGGEGSEPLAELVTLWSKYCSSYTYEAKDCIMMCNLNLLREWCQMAIDYNHTRVHMVMHGTSEVEPMLKDARCFNLMYSTDFAYAKWGIYVSKADVIPTAFNRCSGTNSKSSGYPDGSGIFGLLLLYKPDEMVSNDGDIHEYTMPEVPHKGYCHKNDPAVSNGWKTAYRFRDRYRFFPLAYMVANGK